MRENIFVQPDKTLELCIDIKLTRTGMWHIKDICLVMAIATLFCDFQFFNQLEWGIRLCMLLVHMSLLLERSKDIAVLWQ